MQRLFELHLDPRQEVPPHLAGERLTHHHGGSAEVNLTTSDITHSQSARWTDSKKQSQCVSAACERLRGLYVCIQSVNERVDL